MINVRAVICYVSRLKIKDPSCTTVYVRQADLDELRRQIGDPIDTINGMRISVNDAALPLPRKK